MVVIIVIAVVEQFAPPRQCSRMLESVKCHRQTKGTNKKAFCNTFLQLYRRRGCGSEQCSTVTGELFGKVVILPLAWVVVADCGKESVSLQIPHHLCEYLYVCVCVAGTAVSDKLCCVMGNVTFSSCFLSFILSASTTATLLHFQRRKDFHCTNEQWWPRSCKWMWLCRSDCNWLGYHLLVVVVVMMMMAAVVWLCWWPFYHGLAW